jgi:hypothetical protein
VWTWKFILETYYAITVNSTNGAAALLRWSVEVEGQTVNNTYLNYTAPTNNAAFDASFNIPEVCQGNILPCDNYYNKGLLSEKSYKRFKRAAKK